jgi:hypothetical protein
MLPAVKILLKFMTLLKTKDIINLQDCRCRPICVCQGRLCVVTIGTISGALHIKWQYSGTAFIYWQPSKLTNRYRNLRHKPQFSHHLPNNVGSYGNKQSYDKFIIVGWKRLMARPRKIRSALRYALWSAQANSVVSSVKNKATKLTL